MHKLAKYLVLGAPFLLSCGPSSPTDDAADSVSHSTLDADCQSFCSQAVDCDSEEYAADWEFESQQECVDDCASFTNWKSDPHYGAECVDITRALWVCAAMLETCEDFKKYEDAAFAKGAVGHPCGIELDAFFEQCN